MNHSVHPFPWFEFVSGWLFFVAFLCFGFCLATLRHHVDTSKLATSDDINRAIRASIPKREVLTRSGLVRYKLAIISLLVSVGTAAVIIVRNLAE